MQWIKSTIIKLLLAPLPVYCTLTMNQQTQQDHLPIGVQPSLIGLCISCYDMSKCAKRSWLQTSTVPPLSGPEMHGIHVKNKIADLHCEVPTAAGCTLRPENARETFIHPFSISA